MKLHTNTPRSVTHFLAGSLPGTALVHIRILSNFGMISRKPDSLLHRVALDYFSVHKPSAKSWFSQVREICLLYQLPHPLILLKSQFEKEAFKKLVKKAVKNYWECKFRLESEELSSLRYFHPQCMTLSSPHHLWLAASSSPYEVSKAIVQAKMLSGRYRTELLCRHWSSTNKQGWCQTPDCQGAQVQEDLEHILAFCPSLDHTRKNLKHFTIKYAELNPILAPILSTHTDIRHPHFFQFLIDCTSIPEVITISHLYGITVLYKLLYVGRTWCYSLHRDRARLLNRWRY